MDKAWTHPEIGVFVSDGGPWEADIENPWKHQFRYRDGEAEAEDEGNKILAVVKSDDPDPLAVEQLDRLLGRPPSVAKKNMRLRLGRPCWLARRR